VPLDVDVVDGSEGHRVDLVMVVIDAGYRDRHGAKVAQPLVAVQNKLLPEAAQRKARNLALPSRRPDGDPAAAQALAQSVRRAKFVPSCTPEVAQPLVAVRLPLVAQGARRRLAGP
jgi:hypothetical protein